MKSLSKTEIQGRTRQRVVAVVLAVASLAYLMLALQLPWGRVSRPGSGFFPQIAAGLGLVLAFGSALWARRELDPPPAEYRKPLVFSALLIAVSLLLEPLGFILTGTLLTAVLAWQLGASKVWQVAAVALPAPWVMHYLFVHAFEIKLPAGLLAPWVAPMLTGQV